MAAPRRYSDHQRAAMLRLYEAGKSPADIARLCNEGMAGVAPFEIPRRTVHDIVTRMAAEAERNLPTSVAEAESAEAVERFPVRVVAILDAEIVRLEAKQKRGPLTVADLDFLQKAATLSFDLHKRLNRREAEGGRASRFTRQAAGPQRAPESALEKLAREMQEQTGADAQPSSTHACQSNEQPKPATVAAPPPPENDAPDRTADVRRITAEALARATPQRRAEAARKARALVGGAG